MKASQPPHVAMIGTGQMGSALAQALARGGCRVTAWNRTATRARPLAASGIVIADSVAAAVASADIALICVADAAAVRDAVQTGEVASRLAGKLVVNYTSGKAKDARDFAAWVTKARARPLHGAIAVYPSGVGTADGAILYAGDRKAFEQRRDTLRILAGDSRFISDDPGASCLIEHAMFAFYYGAMLAFYQGAAVLERERIDLQHFAAIARTLLPVIGSTIDLSLPMIARRDYSGSDAHLGVHLAAITAAHEDAAASGVPADILAAFHQVIERAVARAGGFNYELPVAFEVFRHEEAKQS